MLEVWQSIAKKLELTEEECVLLHCFNRGIVNKLGQRLTYMVVSNLVEKFGLDDREGSKSYGAQLLAKGILDRRESAIFNGDRYEENETTQTTEADGGKDSAASGPAGD